ncbi:hypothetical protein BD626DRAFT_241887 [Schizophyllum amplum]|uniref:Uncharacterized protein n=1 Tax=Schizophyllum amplum TaxID=97359 RepID=A0A550BVW0_9AGAR|nr:hypothetical protein BD626DRAFT_241887 [Auriculariopsis ampla]
MAKADGLLQLHCSPSIALRPCTSQLAGSLQAAATQSSLPVIWKTAAYYDRRRAVLPQIYVNKDLATMLMTQHSAQALLFSCSACLLQDTSSEHGIKSVINMTASSEYL